MHGFNFGDLIPKTRNHYLSQSKVENSEIKISLKKLKSNLKKLTPLHWYDGVWDDLDYKM